MPKWNVLIATAVACALLASCKTTSLPPPRPHDFVGTVESGDASQDNTTIELTDGTRVVIPGTVSFKTSCIGSTLNPRSARCVVIGALVEGTQQADWIAVLTRIGESDEPGFPTVLLYEVTDGTGVVGAGKDTTVTFPFAPAVTFECHNAPDRPVAPDEVYLPPAAIHHATLDVENQRLVHIACGYAD